jgi:ribosomal protein S17E
MSGMDGVPSLAESVDGVDKETADQIEDDVKTEIGKNLKEVLDKTTQKIKDAVEHGKKVSEKLVDTVKTLVDKLKDLGIDAHEQGTKAINSIKEKGRKFLDELLEKLGLKTKKEDKTEKRGIADLLANFDISAILENLKAKLAEHLSFDKIVQKVKDYFGNGFLANSLIDTLKTKGADAFKNLLDRLLTTFGGNKEARSLKDIIDGIRGFFSKLGLEFQGKFAQFGEWVQAMWKDGSKHAGNKIAALKVIAKEMIEHAKDVREEVAREALEYLGQYKEQLGDLYQKVKDSVKEAIKNKVSEE